MLQQLKQNLCPQTKVLKDNKNLNDKDQLICLYNNNHNKKNNSVCNDTKIVKMLQAVH
jgi:hypothetical protein